MSNTSTYGRNPSDSDESETKLKIVSDITDKQSIAELVDEENSNSPKNEIPSLKITPFSTDSPLQPHRKGTLELVLNIDSPGKVDQPVDSIGTIDTLIFDASSKSEILDMPDVRRSSSKEEEEHDLI